MINFSSFLSVLSWQFWNYYYNRPRPNDLYLNSNRLVEIDRTIFVGLNSAALKHELSFRKEEIVANINKFCGYKLVDQIVIR